MSGSVPVAASVTVAVDPYSVFWSVVAEKIDAESSFSVDICGV